MKGERVGFSVKLEKTQRTTLKVKTSKQRDLNKAEKWSGVIQEGQVQVSIVRSNQLQMYQAESNQVDSTPPGKVLREMEYYMLKQNWQCHAFMRQVDITMGCINKSAS